MKRFFVLTSILWLTSCQSQYIDQKFLFELERQAYAWGFYHSGMYIDNTGKIYQYEYKGYQDTVSLEAKEEIFLIDKEWLSEEELMKKYSFHKEIKIEGRIPRNLLFEKYQLIKTVSEGELLSSNRRIGGDAGSVRLLAYQYDQTRRQYRRIVLLSANPQQMNSSQSTQLLTDWLINLWFHDKQQGYGDLKQSQEELEKDLFRN